MAGHSLGKMEVWASQFVKKQIKFWPSLLAKKVFWCRVRDLDKLGSEWLNCGPKLSSRVLLNFEFSWVFATSVSRAKSQKREKKANMLTRIDKNLTIAIRHCLYFIMKSCCLATLVLGYQVYQTDGSKNFLEMSWCCRLESNLRIIANFCRLLSICQKSN